MCMQKEKFHIEYIFDKVSNHSLWNHLTTPRGLSSWFADDVNIHSQTYTFTWRKVQEQAVVIKLEPRSASVSIGWTTRRRRATSSSSYTTLS